MENKRLGVILGLFSVVFLIFLIMFNQNLSDNYDQLGCSPNEECKAVKQNISLIHIGFGFFGFMFALGFYLLFFNKAEQNLMKNIEKQNDDEKFNFAMKLLDPSEAKVLSKIREEEGITQSTLRLKLDMSKAKLSYVLQDLEKRGLIKRVEKGKTLQIFSKI